MAVNQISCHLRSAVTEWALVPGERHGEAPSGWYLVWCRSSCRDFVQKQPAGFCLQSYWMCLVQQLRSDIIVLLIKHLQTTYISFCRSCSFSWCIWLSLLEKCAFIQMAVKTTAWSMLCLRLMYILFHLQPFKTVSCVNNLGWKKVNKVNKVSFKNHSMLRHSQVFFVKCKTILMQAVPHVIVKLLILFDSVPEI